MKKLFTSFAALMLATFSFSQTTEYETGNMTGDGWTGWSTPVLSNCSGNINGVDHWQFTGTNGASYSIETYRQFNINSNDIDIYFDILTQDCTVEIEYSSDNVSYSNVFSQTYGSGLGIQQIVVPTVDAGGIPSFYLKIKVNGTFGSPSTTNFQYMKIDAVLNSGNSNAIAPTATQNILEGQNGSILTVTEMPLPASSREWKWTTTSGSGYQSFSPTETGTTYTPNFASAGTYYVVCESDFSGDVVVSNEVQINVGPASIEELELNANVIYNSGLIQVITTMQEYQFSLYNLNGQLITSDKNISDFDLGSYNAGIYLIKIDDLKGNTKTFKIAHE